MKYIQVLLPATTNTNTFAMSAIPSSKWIGKDSSPQWDLHVVVGRIVESLPHS